MKCALVTGASRGIGKAIAIQLAKDHGLHILVNFSSNIDAANNTKDEILSIGGSAEIMQFNVGDSEQVNKSLSEWINKNKNSNIEVLVNNAGITRDNIFPMLNEKDWDDVINVSVKGMYNCTQAVIFKMLRARKGKIINIASLSGLKGVPGQTNYSAAKGAMIAATKALSQEVAKRKITVNAVAPGFIKSVMSDSMPEEIIKAGIAQIPVGRIGTPEDMGHAYLFLASKEAGFVSGHTLHANGGAMPI